MSLLHLTCGILEPQLLWLEAALYNHNETICTVHTSIPYRRQLYYSVRSSLEFRSTFLILDPGTPSLPP